MFKKKILCLYCGKTSEVMVSLSSKEVHCPVCNDTSIKVLKEEKKNVFGYDEEKEEQRDKVAKDNSTDEQIDTWRSLYWND